MPRFFAFLLRFILRFHYDVGAFDALSMRLLCAYDDHTTLKEMLLRCQCDSLCFHCAFAALLHRCLYKAAVNLDICSFQSQTSDEMDLLDQAALLHIAILQEEMLLQEEEDEIMAMAARRRRRRSKRFWVHLFTK
jgi:hypothetical protein